jgi:hypothetical protein
VLVGDREAVRTGDLGMTGAAWVRLEPRFDGWTRLCGDRGECLAGRLEQPAAFVFGNVAEHEQPSGFALRDSDERRVAQGFDFDHWRARQGNVSQVAVRERPVAGIHRCDGALVRLSGRRTPFFEIAMVAAAHDQARVSDGASGGARGAAIIGAGGFVRLVVSLHRGGERMLEGLILPEKHPLRIRMTSHECVVHMKMRHRPHCA